MSMRMYAACLGSLFLLLNLAGCASQTGSTDFTTAPAPGNEPSSTPRPASQRPPLAFGDPEPVYSSVEFFRQGSVMLGTRSYQASCGALDQTGVPGYETIRATWTVADRSAEPEKWKVESLHWWVQPTKENIEDDPVAFNMQSEAYLFDASGKQLGRASFANIGLGADNNTVSLRNDVGPGDYLFVVRVCSGYGTGVKFGGYVLYQGTAPRLVASASDEP